MDQINYNDFKAELQAIVRDEGFDQCVGIKLEKCQTSTLVFNFIDNLAIAKIDIDSIQFLELSYGYERLCQNLQQAFKSKIEELVSDDYNEINQEIIECYLSWFWH